jgi:site-specific recombinase XerD
MPYSFGTHLLDGRADILSISHLLGHGDLKTPETYTHIDARHLDEEYQRYRPRA